MAANLSLLSRYLGRRVLGLLALGVLAGILLFGAELGVALLLKSLVLAVTPGVLKPGGFSLGAIDHVKHPLRLIGLVVALVSVRAVLLWISSFLHGAVQDQFKFMQRRRLIDWIYMRREASSSRANLVLFELIPQAGTAVGAVQAGLVALVTTLCMGFQLFSIAPKLTAAVGIVVLVCVLPIRLISRMLRQSSQANSKNWQRVNSRLVMGLKNLLLLRIYGLQTAERGLANRSLKSHLSTSLRHSRWASVTHAYTQSVAVILVCSVAQYARLQSDQHLTEALIPYFYLLYRLLGQASTFSHSVSQMIAGSVQFRGAFDWWKTEGRDGTSSAGRALYDSRSISHSGLVDSRGGAVAWKAEGVTFRHPGVAEPVLKSLSFEIPAGSFTVIVGASGSGKSTLISLLLGEDVPDAGRVLVAAGQGYVPLTQLRGSLLEGVGYVGAESFLVEGTIRENLLYGIRRPMPDEEIRRACEMAECEFIFSMPAGLEQRITEQGAGLSMGQKQRIGMARALLRNPSALILDEATANLDVATERKLLETLLKLKGRMTIIASTHHQELLKFADQVIDLGHETKRDTSAA